MFFPFENLEFLRQHQHCHRRTDFLVPSYRSWITNILRSIVVCKPGFPSIDRDSSVQEYRRQRSLNTCIADRDNSARNCLMKLELRYGKTTKILRLSSVRSSEDRKSCPRCHYRSRLTCALAKGTYFVKGTSTIPLCTMQCTLHNHLQ
jgi:hypothetical protein